MRNHIMRILAKSPRHRMHVAAWENTGPTYEPCLSMRDWTVEESAEIASSGHGVQLAEGVELARTFTSNLTDG